MLFSVEQAFVGREEIRAPLKKPAWEAMAYTKRLLLRPHPQSLRYRRNNCFKSVWESAPKSFFGPLLEYAP